MSNIVLTDAEGVETEVLMQFDASGKYACAEIRAPSRDAWDFAAVYFGLASPTDDGESLLYRRGVFVDHLGPVAVVEATYDEDGTELTPATLDTRHHLNLVVPRHTVSWEAFALQWTRDGVTDADPNASEDARWLNNIALINRETISSRVRALAGG